MTRVYMAQTGETIEVGDLYANRLIEQGLAMYVDSDDEDEGYVDPGEIVDLGELVEDIRIIQAIVGALARSRAGDFVTAERLAELAGIGQADAVMSIGTEIPMTYTDRSGGTETAYSYPYIIGGIADASGADGVKYKKSLWMVPKYAGPYRMQFDGAPQESWLNPESGEWKQSILRQWMNSGAAAGDGWWKAVGYKDAPPSVSDLARPGWMNGMDAAWLAAALKVRIGTPVRAENVWKMDYTEDTFFPPSIEMIHVRWSEAASGEEALEWFRDSEEAHDTEDTEGRERLQIKPVSSGFAGEVWTRSGAGNPRNAWIILPNGTVNGNHMAGSELYPLPCFVIAGEPETVWNQENAPEEGDEGEWTDESIYRYYIDERGHLIQEKTEDVGTEGEIVGEGRLQITGE